ncbi:hypothetical protein IPA_08340 [Ignicoccus pacificus DSM 13166]|uniref:Uncharacterized protein n=1 Tax=Ignicoccus pacificus DSM 13166 TaxID=940294 RepID=A0A977PLT0_9CREN|nr:hypothetical protein IPA_08340 [Ignicoccus pacificus DSM 13166]
MIVLAKTGFIILRGDELKEFVKKWGTAKVVSLSTDDPVLVVVDKQTVESVPEDHTFVVFLPLPMLEELGKRKVKPRVIEEEVTPKEAEEEKKEEEKAEKKEEMTEEKWVKKITEQLKWTLVELSDKLPFTVTDVDSEFDEDMNMWVIKVRLTRTEKISTSVMGAAKLVLEYLNSILQNERFPNPLAVVVSLEGHTLYVVADIILDDLIKTLLVSKGLIVKDYIITIDLAENRINALVVAEKSPNSKVGLFSGYKVAEEIGKVIKERLKWKGVVRVKMKVGMFDYIKVV